MVLKSAVTRLLPILQEGKSEADVKEAIAADPKKFTESEIDEIYKALLVADATPDTAAGVYKVNFGVHIPELGKTYTKAELEADVEAIEYLVSIDSKAITILKK